MVIHFTYIKTVSFNTLRGNAEENILRFGSQGTSEVFAEARFLDT